MRPSTLQALRSQHGVMWQLPYYTLFTDGKMRLNRVQIISLRLYDSEGEGPGSEPWCSILGAQLLNYRWLPSRPFRHGRLSAMRGVFCGLPFLSLFSSTPGEDLMWSAVSVPSPNAHRSQFQRLKSQEWGVICRHSDRVEAPRGVTSCCVGRRNHTCLQDPVLWGCAVDLTGDKDRLPDQTRALLSPLLDEASTLAREDRTPSAQRVSLNPSLWETRTSPI